MIQSNTVMFFIKMKLLWLLLLLLTYFCYEELLPGDLPLDQIHESVQEPRTVCW